MAAPVLALRRPRASKERAADLVFKELARQILKGELVPGSPLPAEREIAQRFDVSSPTARQALYRLHDLGLLEMRQGRASIVRDPVDAHDLRIISLSIELANRGDRDTRDLAERVIVQCGGMLQLAEPRITPAQLTELANLIADFEARGAPDEDFQDFEERFWTAVAESTGNQIYIRETRWWFTFLRERDLGMQKYMSPPAIRLGIYREVYENLRDEKGAARIYAERAQMAVAILFPHQNGVQLPGPRDT